MPVVGEIRAFGFERLDPDKRKDHFGWMECAGQAPQIEEFEELYKALDDGNLWGRGDGETFLVPDLRGEFLRGWNHGAKGDPEAVGRRAGGPGAADGDRVGSRQGDAFREHDHPLANRPKEQYRFQRQEGTGTHAWSDEAMVAVKTGGAETRPRNASVMYCIFAGRAVPEELRHG